MDEKEAREQKQVGAPKLVWRSTGTNMNVGTGRSRLSKSHRSEGGVLHPDSVG